MLEGLAIYMCTIHICVYVCVCVRERERVCVCVSVCVCMYVHGVMWCGVSTFKQTTKCCYEYIYISVITCKF